MQLFKDNLNDILVDKPIYLEELTLFPIHFTNTYTDGDLITFDEVLNYDDQTLFDFIFKNESLGDESHEVFINKHLKKFSKQGNF